MDMAENKQFRLLALGGDGVGPELLDAQLKVLDWFVSSGRLACEISQAAFGLDAYRKHEALIDRDTAATLPHFDAVLLGAIGADTEYASVPAEARRDWGMVRIRKEIGAIANIRPVRSYPETLKMSPLRPEIVDGSYIVLVRELSGGLYVGTPRGIETLESGERRATNTQTYTSSQIHRVARIGFELAKSHETSVTSIDKAIVLETGRLWRAEVQTIRDNEYPGISLEHMTVDDCAREIVRRPRDFGIVLADNVFGDILTDCAAAIAASPAMMPSASISENTDGRRHGLYESMCGSALHLAGTGKVNPLGAILAVGLAMDYSFGQPSYRSMIERAVSTALATGLRPADITSNAEKADTTKGITQAVIQALDQTV
jgi:3-isopropylmalate dehydrogenase